MQRQVPKWRARASAVRLAPALPVLLVMGALLLFGKTAPASALAPTDGWTVRLIPGTDKILTGADIGVEVPPGGHGVPAPAIFTPEVAVDADRVLYTALYDRTPQVYLYEVASGKVTQLTDEQGTSFGRPLLEGRWAVWVAGEGRGHIHLRDLESGATQEFSPQGYVESLQLVGGRLAWQENLPSGGGRLLLYDPARDGAEAAEEASWTRIFAMDEGHLLWVDGADPTKLYLHDLLSGETTELLQASQPVESVAIGGQVVAWADRTGDRTTIRVHRLDEAETTTLDTFGPFYPDLDTDGRYVAWTGGENATGPRAHLYDTQAETTVVLGSADFQGSAPILDQGRVAWSRFFSGRGRQAVLVQDLATGLTTQLSNGPFDSGRPIMSGGTVVWTLHNPHYQSPTGRGVLVATAPKSPPKPAFADLAPNGLYRSATEWLGEQGYATGYPDGETFKFRGEQPLLRSQLGKLLVEILDIPLSEEPASFSDLEMGGSADSYAVRATATLANLGILKGTGGHRLEGYAPLSRAQAITLVVRAADYARPGLLPTTPEGYPGLLFTDPTHGANVTRAGFASLPDGLLGYVWRGERWLPWDVWAPISRGEAAQMLWNLAGIYLESWE